MCIGIIGAGVQGFSTAVLLSQMHNISKIIICDRDCTLLKRVLEKINSEKVTCVICDVINLASKRLFFKDCDVIIDLLPPRYTLCVMDFALQIDANYINSAFDEPFWSELISHQVLSKHREFCEIKKSAFLGFGYSPGLTNIIIRKYCDIFDSIDSISIYGTYSYDEFSNDSPWIQTWSPEQATKDYLTKPCVFQNGKYLHVALFSEKECIDFGPFGQHLVSLHSHEEVYSIPRTIKKQIGTLRFKFQYNDFLEKLSRLGFLPDNTISLHGNIIRPFDLLVKLIPSPIRKYLDGVDFMAEDYITKIVFCGKAENQEQKFTVTVPVPRSYVSGIDPEVAVPLATMCQLLTHQQRYGIIFPEEISADLFLEKLEKISDFQESCHFEEV